MFPWGSAQLASVHFPFLFRIQELWLLGEGITDTTDLRLLFPLHELLLGVARLALGTRVDSLRAPLRCSHHPFQREGGTLGASSQAPGEAWPPLNLGSRLLL